MHPNLSLILQTLPSGDCNPSCWLMVLIGPILRPLVSTFSTLEPDIPEPNLGTGMHDMIFKLLQLSTS